MAFIPGDLMVVNRGGTDYKALIDDLLAITKVNDGQINIKPGSGLEGSGTGEFTANQSDDRTQTLTVKTAGGITIDANGNVIIDPNFNLDSNVTPPNDGTLSINDASGNSVGTFTANQAGDTTITLPEGFSGDYNDLTNKPCVYECNTYIPSLQELP